MFASSPIKNKITDNHKKIKKVISYKKKLIWTTKTHTAFTATPTQIIQQRTFKVTRRVFLYLWLKLLNPDNIYLVMVMGPGENKMDGQQGKQPILLSLGLITDVLIMGFSISILLLIALNMPKQDQTQSFNECLFATLFGWITSMFGGIYWPFGRKLAMLSQFEEPDSKRTYCCCSKNSTWRK